MVRIGSQKKFWNNFVRHRARQRPKGFNLERFISQIDARLAQKVEERSSIAGDLPIPSFLEELAKAQPDPGGGAAAAYSIILSLALVEKVVRLELRQAERTMGRVYLWETSLTQLDQMKDVFARLQEEDVQAYLNLAKVRAEYATGEELLRALSRAVNCPLKIMNYAQMALQLVAWIGAHCRKHLVSDLLVSCEIIRAALQGAYHLANANLQLIYVEDEAWQESRAKELLMASQEGQELFQGIREKLAARE
jgi:formiminotetrahydrofolate cyclodeaminase